MSTEVLTFANRYADAGISELAVKTDGTKGPDGDAWKQWQDRIPNAAERSRMFRGHVGIGILGGKRLSTLTLPSLSSHSRQL